jgi:hypothetical protein
MNTFSGRQVGITNPVSLFICSPFERPKLRLSPLLGAVDAMPVAPYLFRAQQMKRGGP